MAIAHSTQQSSPPPSAPPSEMMDAQECKVPSTNDHEDIDNLFNELRKKSDDPNESLNDIRKCVGDIDLNLSVANVLKMLQAMNLLTKKPTEKPIVKQEQKPNAHEVTKEDYLGALFYNVLQFIDMNAEEVLKKGDIRSLDYKEVEMIVKSDHIMISEVGLYNFLSEWSRLKCNEKLYDLTFENRRKVLGSLCFAPRYLLMTEHQFDTCSQLINLLDEDEIILIKNAFKGKLGAEITVAQAENIEYFKKPRPKYATMPVELSLRSESKNYPKKMRDYNKDDFPWYYCFYYCFAIFFD